MLEMASSCDLLPFSLGTQSFVIEARWVREIVGRIESVQVPRADARVARAFLWNGRAVPLIQLEKCLKWPDVERGKGPERTVIVELGAGAVAALPVDAVGEVLNVSPEYDEEQAEFPFLIGRAAYAGDFARWIDLPKLVEHVLRSVR